MTKQELIQQCVDAIHNESKSAGYANISIDTLYEIVNAYVVQHRPPKTPSKPNNTAKTIDLFNHKLDKKKQQEDRKAHNDKVLRLYRLKK